MCKFSLVALSGMGPLVVVFDFESKNKKQCFRSKSAFGYTNFAVRSEFSPPLSSVSMISVVR